MERGEWVSADELATLAGVTVQGARKALRAAAAGKLWRGCQLKTRQVSGRGGKNGKHYEVSLSSLSEALGADLSGRMTPLDLDALDPRQLIDLATVAESKAAKVKIIEAWRRKTGKSRETAYRVIRKVEAGGHVATLRKKPSNAGQPRVAVSRAFTKAWLADGRALDDAFALHEQLAGWIAKAWSQPLGNVGAKRLGRLAGDALQDWCREQGFAPKGRGARAAFGVPPKMVNKSKSNRVVHIKKTNAAAHYNASPYRRSDLSRLLPMEVLMGDVHNIDVKSTREDGSGSWCIKMITWMDVSTRRAWVDLKTCRAKEAVRQVDVNASLASVFKDPDWGSPDYLWVDNGPEYKLLDGLVEPMRAAALKVGRAPVIRSIPYNARGKGLIEGFFHRFERGWLSMLPGYSGGDRMKTPTANQGRALEPLKASPDVAEKIIYRFLEAYNNDPQDALEGRSPNEVFAERRTERAAITWSIEALGYALAKRDDRTVLGGQVQINNRFYDVTGDAMVDRTKVDVLHGPFIQGGVLVEHDGELIFAREAPVFGPLDAEGSRYSQARKRQFNEAISGREASLPAVDPLAEVIAKHVPEIDLAATQKATVQRAISAKERRAQDEVATDAQRAKAAEVASILKRLPAPQRARVA